MIKNTKYFPKTTEVFEDSKKIGVKEYKEFYKITHLGNYLNEVFADEYRTYIKNEMYFPGCPLKIYRKTYHERLEDYQLTYPDADEFDFLKYEDAIIHRLYLMDVERKDNFYPFYPYLFSDPHWKNFDLSVKKTRLNFIDKRVIELDHYFYVTGVDPIDYDRVPREHFELRRNPDARDIETPQFFEYRKPTLEKVTSNPNTTDQTIEQKLSARETAYLAYYFVEGGEYKLNDNIGNERDWRYFSDISGGSSVTNIRKYFKEIENNKDIRLKLSRLSKIKNTLYFIENNFPDKPNVINEAKKELEIIQNK